MRHPVGRVGRIDRHVGAPRREHAEEPHRHGGRPLGEHADRHLGADPHPCQLAGELGGAARELAVGERLVAGGERHPLRGARRLLGDQLVDRPLRRVRRGRGVPLDQDLRLLGRREERQVEERPRGIVHRPGEEGAPVREQALGRRGVEQVGVEDERGDEALLPRRHLERQVELRRPLAQGQRGQRERAQPHRRPRLPDGEGGEGPLLRQVRLLEHEHRLEERRAAGVAHRLQTLGQQCERVLLVLQGGERRPPDARQETFEGEVARGLRAHHDRIDEVADHAGELAGGAPGRRAPDRQLPLPGVAVEERLEARQQHRERRRSRRSREALESCREVR